jgi:hypothetical protein
MALCCNNLKGTIPSSLASLTLLKQLILDKNNLKGTIPSCLASLTLLKQLDLRCNALTGLVPPLPFKQYSGDGSGGCGLDAPESGGSNHFKCPLPAGNEQCKIGGSAGVHCQ